MNLLAFGRATQGTSAAMITTPSDIFTGSGVRQSTPTSATIINTPPVFGGITGLVANPNGSLTASWVSGTTVNSPLEYLVYIGGGTLSSSALYALPPFATTQTTMILFMDSNGNILSPGTYTVGVKAKDGVQNLSSNIQLMTAVSSGLPVTSVNNLLNQIIATVGTPANSTVSADIAQVEANVVAIKNGINAQIDLTEEMYLPISGSKVYPLRIRFTNALGVNIDPDSNSVMVDIVDAFGSVVLSSVAMTRSSVGVYRYDYSAQFNDSSRVMIVEFNFTYQTVALVRRQVVETLPESQNLASIIATLGTPAGASVSADVASVKSDTSGLRSDYTTTRAAGLDNLDTNIASRATQVSVNNVQSSVNSIPTNPLLTNDARLNNLDATVSSRAATADARFVHLDADISSRAATADVRFAHLDVDMSSRATQVSVDAIPTNPLQANDARLNNLDATISSREASSDPRLANLDASISSRATQTSVNQIQNNTLSVFVVPERMVIPDSGSTNFKFYAYFYNEIGIPIDPDLSHVNVTIKDVTGAVISGPTLMSRAAVGNYNFTNAVSSSATEQTQYVFFDYAVNGVSLEQVRTSEVTISQSDIDVLLNRLTAQRAANLDNLDATISSRSTQTSVNAIPTNPLQTNDSRLNNLDVAVSSRSTQGSVAAIPTNPLLTNDARLNNLDITISSRSATSDSRFAHLDADISSREPANDPKLSNLNNLDIAVSSRAATADARFVHLDADISSRASQSSMDARPTNPLLTNDVRLNNLANLDATVSSRATQVSVNAIPTDPLTENDARLDNLDAKVSTRATQSSLDADFGNMSNITNNLTTVQTALSADVVTLAHSITIVDSDIGQCVVAADTALAAANSAEAAAVAIDDGIVQLNNDLSSLEGVTAELSKDAMVLATSNLSGTVTDDDALIGVLESDSLVGTT